MIYDYKGITPRVAPDAYIAPTAAVVGDVSLAEKSSVWFGAVVRGDVGPISIGWGTNIQDNAVVHCEHDTAMVIGENVTVGHGAIVHCTSVGDSSLIGMGAVCLSRSVIGRCCVIAAGAVVKENSVIPDYSMVVGVPGRIVRTLDAEAVAKMQQENFYVGLTKEYLESEK